MFDVSDSDLLHPTRGGTAAHKAKTQVNAQQAIAWWGLKEKFPRGLQTTSHLSNAITARDHRLTIPGAAKKGILDLCYKAGSQCNWSVWDVMVTDRQDFALICQVFNYMCFNDKSYSIIKYMQLFGAVTMNAHRFNLREISINLRNFGFIQRHEKIKGCKICKALRIMKNMAFSF